MNVYISRNYKDTNSAGNKAKTDIETLMKRKDFKNIGLKQTHYSNKIIVFMLNSTGVLKACFLIRQGDTLFLQYPVKKYFTFICQVAHIQNAHVVALIHDLGSFRRKKLTIDKEIKRLSYCDYIIAHNGKMKRWLIDNKCKVTIGELGIFDLLSTTKANVTKTIKTPYRIIFAGALAQRKNAFLYEINECLADTELLLYGNGFDDSAATSYNKLKYMGFLPAEQLISSVQGDFGLVWDGDSLDACSGAFGEYLKYNNPHKTSLYIRCGLPIIMWRQAALASFVEQERIGVCVESLKEIDETLSNISPEKYKEMRNNVLSLSHKLASGHFFYAAAKLAIDKIASL